MPLFDHFHPPLSTQLHWEAFHASWAVKLADTLTEHVLPAHFMAEAMIHLGPSVEIDVATMERTPAAEVTGNGAGKVAVSSRARVATVPTLEIPATFPDTLHPPLCESVLHATGDAVLTFGVPLSKSNL